MIAIAHQSCETTHILRRQSISLQSINIIIKPHSCKNLMSGLKTQLTNSTWIQISSSLCKAAGAAAGL
jgi:hypothetical protein